MALRIASATTAAPSRRNVIGQARAAVTRGDGAAYAAAWPDAAAIADEHERYGVRKQLAELALGAVTGGSVVMAQRFRVLADALLTVLEGDPREPVLLNYAGVALYELGALDAATPLFDAAERLAPGQTGADGNLAQVARRKREGLHALAGVPRAVAASLPPLVARAKAVAATAQPATAMTLSLCMIVRDEEEALPRCLAAAAPAVDEIVIVDTGSTDRTREIAESFGARVIDFPWTGSFAEARNVSFDAATSDWMMFLDADEVLAAEDVGTLRELLGHTWREAFYLVETSYVGALEDGAGVTHNALRVFRNRPEYRFEGRIHEQILHTLPGQFPERFETVPVRVEHYGYLGVVRDAKQKSRRNLELLERQVDEGEDSAFLHFNLGSEHLALGDFDKALGHLQRGWEKLLASADGTVHGFAPALAVRLAKTLRATGEHAGVHRFAIAALERFPGFTDLVYERALSAREAGDHHLAADLIEQCLEMGDAPSRYSATMGCGSFLALTARAELHALAGRPDEAAATLRRCLAEHPTFLGALDPLAAVLLDGGASPSGLEAAVRESLGEDLPAGARFAIGMALYERGYVGEAQCHFEAVLERQPHGELARVALAESLLSQGALDEAAAQAARIASGGVCAGPARRIEAFCALVAGDHARARAVVDAAGDDLSLGETAFLGAWAAAVRGEQPRPLPASASAPLTTALEALLRIEAVDAFATAVGLLDLTPLRPRERRERLADMYLRRGFLESAGDEWVAACQQDGVDADALVGLAQVALARDLPQDAAIFAAEAAELAPGDPRPARILTAVESAVQVPA